MSNRAPRAVAVLAALSVVAGGGAACSSTSDSGSEPTKESEPITLRLGTDDEADTPGGEQIQHFADEVNEASGGDITIEPVWHAAGETSHWDQKIGTMVGEGDLDLGMVPSRAWDDLGVTSLRALNTPFLITTDTLTETVLTDDDLVEQLTSGLPDAGVSALGLFPEGMRHPFGFAGPLGGPEDYQDGVIRAAYSRTTEAMFQALGATVSDEDADPSTMVGAESSYRLTPAGEATGNVVFYPKVNSLVINHDVLGGLSDGQAATLRDAADATRDWVFENLPSDAESAETFCSQAGKIGAATPDELDALAAASQGLTDELRQDSTTAAIIDAVEDLAAADPAVEPVTGCGGDTAADTAADTSLVDGTYTVTVTPDQTRAAGATDEGEIAENTGDFVITLADGTWTMQLTYAIGPKAGTVYHGTGGFTLSDRHFTWFWGQEPNERTEMDVRVADDGSLVFSRIDDAGDAEAQALSEATFTTWTAKKR